METEDLFHIWQGKDSKLFLCVCVNCKRKNTIFLVKEPPTPTHLAQILHCSFKLFSTVLSEQAPFLFSFLFCTYALYLQLFHRSYYYDFFFKFLLITLWIMSMMGNHAHGCSFFKLTYFQGFASSFLCLVLPTILSSPFFVFVVVVAPCTSSCWCQAKSKDILFFFLSLPLPFSLSFEWE